MVIWVIGLSAAGKTALGREIYQSLKEESSNTVFLDGDELRRLFQYDQHPDCYSLEGRRLQAERVCELCAFLDRQGINVVCSILSIFEESRLWNRENLSHYFEVYISVPFETLCRRETKGLYSKALSGEINNVVGVDIPFVPPSNPDYVFENHKDGVNFKKIASDILLQAKGAVSL